MSKSKENKILEVVKFYYTLYKQNEEAFNNSQDNKKGLKEQLTPLLNKGDNSSQEFKNLAKEYMKIITMYSNEVAFSANKFLSAADINLKVDEDYLPEDISKEYVVLNSTEFKPAFSVSNGRFVRNSKQSLPEVPQKEFDFIFDWLVQNLESS